MRIRPEMRIHECIARGLPVIESCAGCGACCLVVTLPPFHRQFDQSGEDAWERLKWERPELLAEFRAADEARRLRGAPDYGSPCLWFDAESGAVVTMSIALAPATSSSGVAAIAAMRGVGPVSTQEHGWVMTPGSNPQMTEAGMVRSLKAISLGIAVWFLRLTPAAPRRFTSPGRSPS